MVPANTGTSSGAPTSAKYVTAQAESGLSAEVNLGALTTGILKHTVSGSVSTPATAGASDVDSILPTQSGHSGEFLTTNGTTSSWGPPLGLSWGSSINGSTGIGVLLTMSNNSDSAAIAESIVMGNTQSNALIGLQIDTGTAVRNHSALILKVLNTGTSGNSGGFLLNTYSSATQALGTMFGMNSGANFNTNSDYDNYNFYLTNEANAGTGVNSMLYVNNNETTFSTSSGQGTALTVQQQGVGGTSIAVIGNANINSGTNGLFYMTLSNTQSGATIMQKVNMGTSVQSNIGYNVVIPANSTATAFQVDHTGSNNNVSKTLVATTTSSGFSTATFSIFEAIGRNSQIKALEALSVYSGTTGERTTNYVNLKIDRTNTGAFTRTDNFAAFSMIRTDNVNNAGATLNAQGSVGYFQHIAAQTAGTLNDTVNVLELVQDSDSTGYALKVTAGNCYYAGKDLYYNAIATSGWGVPAIYGSGRATAQTAQSAALATYTVGASDGSFEVSANVLVTSSTTHSFSIDVTYTDEGNTSRTLILPMAQLGAAFISGGLITNVTGTGPYESPVMHIRCKAATSITIRPSAGTFTSVTYNAEGYIKQIG